MHGDPTRIDSAYTGGRAQDDETSTVAASRGGRGVGSLAVSSKGARTLRPASVNKAGRFVMTQKTGARRESRFVTDAKELLGEVAAFGAAGAVVGVIIGTFGAPAIAAAVVSGAVIGAAVGLVWGVLMRLSY